MRGAPLDTLEVSTLSQEVFAHLKLSTVSDLLQVDEATFLDAAEQLADGRPFAPALREVKEILADQGLHLARRVPLGSYDACWPALLEEAAALGHAAERTEAGARVVFSGAGVIHITPNYTHDDVSFSWEAVADRARLVSSLRELMRAIRQRG